MRVLAAELTIQRPGHRLLGFNHYPGAPERIHILGINLFDQQRRQNLLQLHGILWPHNKGHLKDPVIENHIFSDDTLKATHRLGIGNHPKEEIPFKGGLFAGNLQLVGLHIHELFHALQHVSHMAQHILHFLLRRVRHIRKDAKGRHIDEIAVI